MSDDINYEWLPLESDPQIFTQYFHDLGLPELIGFEEILSMDPQDIKSLYSAFPVFGVIAAVSRPKGAFAQEKNYIEDSKVPFYMKQTPKLDYACGLVAALHLFGNNRELLEMMDGSTLKNFFDKSIKADSLQKAQILEDFGDMKVKHKIFANQGQSSLSETNENQVERKKSVYHHFISFVNYNDNIIELDGTLKNPIMIKKQVPNESTIEEVAKELKKRLESGLIGEDLSMFFLTYQ